MDLINDDPSYRTYHQLNLSVSFIFYQTPMTYFFLNGFSKELCYKTFKECNDEICPTSYEEYIQLFDGKMNDVQNLFSRLLIALYYKKFRSCLGSKSLT